MKLGTVKIYTTSSNSTIQLSYQNPLILYNIKILALNSKMSLTITVTDVNGSQWSFSLTSGTEISFKKVNYQSITLKDSNTYTVYYTLQPVYADSQRELLELEQETDISIVPVNNAIITSPLDSSGNLAVSIQNQPISTIVDSPLDTSGNIKTSVQAITQSGLNNNAFSNTLATANTKQALAPPSGYPTTAQSFIILINLSPSDTIKVGDVNNQTISLSPNQVLVININKPQTYFNITSIYWVAATASTDAIGVMYA